MLMPEEVCRRRPQAIDAGSGSSAWSTRQPASEPICGVSVRATLGSHGCHSGDTGRQCRIVLRERTYGGVGSISLDSDEDTCYTLYSDVSPLRRQCCALLPGMTGYGHRLVSTLCRVGNSAGAVSGPRAGMLPRVTAVGLPRRFRAAGRRTAVRTRTGRCAETRGPGWHDALAGWSKEGRISSLPQPCGPPTWLAPHAVRGPLAGESRVRT
jgi:hypothetical protein